MKLACVLLALGACGDNRYDNLPYFDWSGQPAVGAFGIDHLAGDDPGMLGQVDLAAANNEVVLFYGHDPPQFTTYEAIDGLLSRAELRGLPTFTFADLAAGGPPRAGICLSFDDTEVDAWFALRDLLARYHAHVSFFVTRYAQFTDDGRAELHQLAADGNSIEAHGVNHAYANEYIPTFGLDAYLDDEIQPSIDILRADGFAVSAYAHPGGAHTRELDEALASRIAISRTISGRPK